MDTEQTILELALQTVGSETGLELSAQQQREASRRPLIDGYVRIIPNNSLRPVEIKKGAQNINTGALINQMKALPQHTILVSDYINPNMAEKLRRHSIEFIDTAGNAYINDPPIYIYVSGKKNNRPSGREIIRAFEPKGLRVIFTFLCDPDFVDASYRDIADKANVAVGTVGWVIDGLKSQNYIYQKGSRGSRQIVNYRKLLDRWVETYPEKLKPKHQAGRFLSEDSNLWKKADAQSYGGYWSGEVAAALLMEYLNPQTAILYLPDAMKGKFLLNNRLKKADENDHEKPGSITFYRPFWLETSPRIRPWSDRGLAHPVLIYADLISTGDVRNLEAAQGIYDEFIAEYCGKD